jgi:hypothetical protein
MTLSESQKSLILTHAERLLDARQYPKTICPSEIARALSAPELQSLGVSEWRAAMDAVRQVVWEKREAGEVEVMSRAWKIFEGRSGPGRLEDALDRAIKKGCHQPFLLMESEISWLNMTWEH